MQAGAHRTIPKWSLPAQQPTAARTESDQLKIGPEGPNLAKVFKKGKETHAGLGLSTSQG